MGGRRTGSSFRGTSHFTNQEAMSSQESVCSSRTMSPEAIQISDDEAASPHITGARSKVNERVPREPSADAISDAEDDVIDMTYEENEDLELQEVTQEDFEHSSHLRQAKEVPEAHELVEFAPHSGGAVIVAGMSVELSDGDFLRVAYIIRNKRVHQSQDEGYTLRGTLLRRCNAMDRFFPRRLNELCAVILMPMNDKRPHLIAGLEDRPLTAFICIREILFTNATFPDFSCRDDVDINPNWVKLVRQNDEMKPHWDIRTASVEARLVCRYKSVKLWYKDHNGLVKLGSNAFLTLDPDEADVRYRRSNAQLLRQWYRKSRGETGVGEEQTRNELADLKLTPGSDRKRGQGIIDLTGADDPQTASPSSSKKRRVDAISPAVGQVGPSRRSSFSDNMVTPRRRQPPSRSTGEKIRGVFIDLYCGSGGASEAAKIAGIHVTIAVDLKLCAVRSHQVNHPQCRTLLMGVSEFIIDAIVGKIICDILHSSNPCRYWSPAHTVPGKDDEANYNAAYMVEQAAKKSGCRIMSFEQTPGFCGIAKHRNEWRMWINQFTSMGFSVEWRIVKLADTGNPNHRKRLFIYATCPGQAMPKYPKPTHGPPGSGLIPYVTVRQAISNIPAWATMHNPEELERSFKAGAEAPAEWDKPLKYLITTSGPLSPHPNGKRKFTVRETLRLQGFPDSYEYRGDTGDQPPGRSAANKMAGDAVPPKATAPYFAAMKEALRVTDSEVAAWKPEIISLDDA